MHLGSKGQLQLIPHDCQWNKCQTKNTDGPLFFCNLDATSVVGRLAVSDPCDRWPSIDVQVTLGPLYYVKCWLCSNGFNICSDYTFIDLKHSVSTNSTDTIHAGTAEMTPFTACIDRWHLQLRMLVHSCMIDKSLRDHCLVFTFAQFQMASGNHDTHSKVISCQWVMLHVRSLELKDFFQNHAG